MSKTSIKCDSCKYFAVPLTKEEKKQAHCPGANPFGDPEMKICTLKGRKDFLDSELDPHNCKYYFPIAIRFR